MRPGEGERFLGSGGAPLAAARLVVAGRPEGIDQDGTVSPPPAGLEGHVRALRDSAAAAPMFAEGWQVALVDLTKVAAFSLPSSPTRRSAGSRRSTRLTWPRSPP